MIRLLSNILLVCALFLAGCSKSDDNASGAGTLSVNPTSVELSAGADSKVVTVTTDAAEWKAVVPEADTWCTVSGKGNELTITAEPNKTEGKRTTRVTVSAGEAAPCYVEVIQQAPAVLSGLPLEVLLSVTGKEQKFTALVEGKLSYTVAKGGEWCTVYVLLNEITFEATPNNTDGERQTVVTVMNGEVSMDITVRQRKASESDFKVGDLYKEDNVTVGVVACVSEEGDAYVLHVDEIRPDQEASSIWAFANVLENVLGTTANDGQKNAEIWRNNWGASNRYKAFYFCDQKNKNGSKDWFLPAQEELEMIADGIAGFGLVKFNEILAGVSGAQPVLLSPYWSSTESDYQQAMVVNLSTGAFLSVSKYTDSQYSTRAVCKITSGM